MRQCILVLVTAVLVFSAGAANASLILTVERGGFEAGYQYGGVNMRIVSETLAEHATVEFGNFDVLSEMLAYDAIWIPFANQDHKLSPLESANLSAFIATGRRVFMHGENFLWNTWNNSLLSLVGGQMSDTEVSNNIAVSIADHELTQDARLLYLIAGGKVSSGPGVPLYTMGSVHLWGDNVLSVFEASMFSSFYTEHLANDVFARNIGRWLSADFTPVPVPPPFALLLLSLPWLAFTVKRRGDE